jgi:toxin YoeB
MEIYFNELSVLPNCLNNDDARDKIITMLETMKALKEFDFNVLRTHDNFYAVELFNGYSFSSFIIDPQVKDNLKLLLRSIVKNPFIADDDSQEAEMFISNQFQTLDHTGIMTSPEGIAISYICEMPTISISGFPLWDSNTLSLNVIDTVSNSTSINDIINISTPNSLNNQTFLDWIKSITEEVKLNSFDNIIKMFPIEKFEFEQRAIDDILTWFYDDKRFIVKIIKLINDIENNPFVGGFGLTETLGGTGGKASKRIVKKDRVIYTYTQEKITIHQCRGHYNDK